MDIEERLKNETLIDLKRIARQLKAKGCSRLNKQALIEHLKANYTEREIIAIIDVKLPGWKKIKNPEGNTIKSSCRPYSHRELLLFLIQVKRGGKSL